MCDCTGNCTCDDLGLPIGPPGAKGDKGDKGDQGPAGVGGTMYTKTYITSAQLKTANGIPIDIIGNPGAGFYVKVLDMDFVPAGTAGAYTTHTEMDVVYATAPTNVIMYDTAILPGAGLTPKNISNKNAGYTIIPNDKVQIKVPAGNPTAGTFDLLVYTFYQIVQL